MADANPVTAPVTDHRIAPRGVLPRHTQTWLMVGVAVGILGIIVFTGHPEPAGRPTAPVASTPLAPNPERLRDYQDRLRVMEERARQQTLSLNDPARDRDLPACVRGDAGRGGTTDPLEGERRAAGVRKPVREQRGDEPSARRTTARHVTRPRVTGIARQPDRRGAASPPNIDDVANAVVRATTRYAPSTLASTTTAPAALAPGGASSTPGTVARAGRQGDPGVYGTDHVHGPDASHLGGHARGHGADQPPGRPCGRARQLSRHQCRLLARRTVRVDSGGLSRAGGNEARPDAWARRGSPSPSIAWCCPMVAPTASISSWG